MVVRGAIVAVYFVVFCVLLPFLLWFAGAWIDGATGWSPLELPPVLGYAVLLPGLGLLGWGMVALWVDGKGLPVSALPPPKLARRGPYRVVRHPIYLGFHVALVGYALLTGSRGLMLVCVVFSPVWVRYALEEEGGLERRFGLAWTRYRSRVGLLPRPPVYLLTRVCLELGLFPLKIEGRIPAGPAVIVANHTCYVDFLFVAATTWRKVWFTTTAEVWRTPAMRRVLWFRANIPLRRYRNDPAACREVLRLLGEGELVGIFPEGERAPLGGYQGSLPDVASILSRLGVPVIPVGISGAYDVGPRWSEVLRRRPVHVRIGAPIVWTGEPKADLDRALCGRLDEDPPRVDMAGLPIAKLARVLWSCPACGADWVPPTCAACGSTVRPTTDGRFDLGGQVQTLAALAAPLWSRPEALPLRVAARAHRERSMLGAPAPLEPMGEGTLDIHERGVAFEGPGGRVELAEIRNASTERADTLQVATRTEMWQFVVADGSAFRLQRAVKVVPTRLRKRG